ncbi:MAG: Chromosome partition protein Smc [Syntrophorhabdaceae bacterium PtaU1.Bin034]|nr:MAG: Chromosome partition protein Smc [Syntrophorhabdaceae bacterium PtaU1.Bin034]
MRAKTNYEGEVEEVMEENLKTLNDYVAILKRRKLSFILPTLVIFLAALTVALVLPPKYRSTSTILIEEQDIPRDYVVTTVTGFAEERLQAINQRIMSATKLLEIMNRFNLYADLRQKMTTEEIIAIMRKDITLKTISAEGRDPRTGQAGTATIAFSLAYDGKQPQVVQQVASVLASLYLEENLKVRAELSAGASRFLEEEAKTVRENLTNLDARIAAFKAKNIEALPELLQVNMQNLDRSERDIDHLRDQLRTLREKESYLETQLATVPAETVSQDKALLKELKAKLVQLENRYSDKYPDVKKTRADIEDLTKRIESSARLEEGGSPKKGLTSVADQPDNPSYVTLASQLAGTQADIESVKRQLIEAEKKRGGYIQRNEASPRVEEAYKALMVERQNLQVKYDDLMKKVLEARVAQGLEKQQMGERFTLIDPARLPEKPVSPNVPAILLVGLFLGIGGGVASVALREYGDQSVRSEIQLALATGYEVIGTVPPIITEEDRQHERTKRIRLVAGCVVLCIAAVLIFHFFIMDLDILWAKIGRRL